MPSLVNGRDMNGFDYDRGGPSRSNGIHANGGFDYRDEYREDMRREEEYRRGMRNGGPTFDSRFGTDHLDQNSLSDFRSNEPKFELDHLATFAAGARNHVIHAEDGLRKLRQMENTTGIWTMRCVLIVERNCLVVLDNSTGEELERFPIQLVQDPTAIFKNDRREIYNNLILFTIVDDPKKRTTSADMHIFQSCKAPAQEIVDEILAAKNGQQRLYQSGGSRIPPPPTGPAPEPPHVYDFNGMRETLDRRETNVMSRVNQVNISQSGQFGAPIGQSRSFITRVNTIREKEDMAGGSTEILERDVQLLNHCFDDIEKFVARLQQAAESYKELEKRKRDRGAKNKKRQSGDGMLNARARPPPDRDFVDIFQKFKLSFNLLAKLKAHIHDPNAPELVHFLFTPLSLIYEASRDPYHGNQNLGDQAVAPVLTSDAKQLLLNCLTSKEIELWQALGKHWTTSRDVWQGHIPGYVPEFYDGWQPAATVIDDMMARSTIMNSGPPPVIATPLPMMEPPRPQSYVAPRPFPDEDRSQVTREFERFEPISQGFEQSTRGGFEQSTRGGFEQSTRGGGGPGGFESTRAFEPISNSRSPAAPSVASRGMLESTTPREMDHLGSSIHRGPSDGFSRERRPRSELGSPYSSEFVEQQHVERSVRRDMVESIPPPAVLSTRQDENSAYLEELRRLGDLTIYEAAHDRVGKNSKELTVEKGDIVQVLDHSKNWWKLRNYKGQVGFAPYTILKPCKSENIDDIGRSQGRILMERSRNGTPSSIRQNDIFDDASTRGASRRDEHGVEAYEPPMIRTDVMKAQSEQQTELRRPVRTLSQTSNTTPLKRASYNGENANLSGSARPTRRPASEISGSSSDSSAATRQQDTKPLYQQEGSRFGVELRHVEPVKPPEHHEKNSEVTVLPKKDYTKITRKSSPNEVMEWLIVKGFPDKVKDFFKGYNGLDMFHLQLKDLQQVMGNEVAIRLDGLLRLQKNLSGYATLTAKELNEILQRRKQLEIDPEEYDDSVEEVQKEIPKVKRGAMQSNGPDYRTNPDGGSLLDMLIRQRSQLRQREKD